MANTQIKGLTVEIGGDTTELTAALKGIDKASKSSSAELGEINRQLKMDPSNTVLLAQKQEVLAKAIGSAKEKLDLLKKAESEAAEQVKKDDIGQEQFRALQREVVYAENKLKYLEKQLQDTKAAADGTGNALEKAGEQSKGAAKDTETLTKEVEKLESAYEKAWDKAKETGTKMGATFAAGAAAVGASIKEAMDYEDALNSIQIQTGASAEGMSDYKKAMDAVYASGTGENLEDIAGAMATIAQQTKETDPAKLQELTESALILKESFGFETAEQMRAVNMLTGKFGISAKEAYDLIVAGAQQGLNKNGDLLDVINEYSSHYAQMGYDAKGFFNSLANGAASGAFTVDALGDAMKEFGIKTKDNATATTEAYALLGLESDKILSMFAAGGKEAQEATRLVVSALFAMEDQVAQNQVGVALFGTKWEDLGKDAIESLMNTNDALHDVEGSIEAVRDINMNSASNQWEQLGRTVQTELILPLGEKALPVAQKLFQYCIDNSDSLIPKLKTLGAMIGTVFVVNKVAKFTKSIKDLVAAYKALKTATQAANAAQSTTVWGAIAAAIALVVGAFTAMVQEQKNSTAAAEEQRDALLELAKNQLDIYTELAEAEKETARQRRETAKAINDEYDGYGKLWDELQDLVDAEGKVLKGNEERVEYIRGKLSDAIGVEIKLVDGQILKYKELSDQMDETLLKQRASRMISSQEVEYQDAKEGLSSQQAAYEAANATWIQYQEDQDLLSKKKDELDKAWEVHNRSNTQVPGKPGVYYPEMDMSDTISALEAEIEILENSLTENAYAEEERLAALRAYDEARTTISQFEALEAAYYSGDMDALAAAMQTAENSYMSADTAHSESLQGQYQDARAEYDRLLSQSKNVGSTITQDQLLAAASAVAITYDAAFGGQVPSTAPWAQQSSLPALLNSLSALIAAPGMTTSSEFLRVEDEAAKGSYELLQRIADRLDQLDLNLVLDDGTLVGRTARKTDYALGNIIAQDRRGTLKE